jgi:hypothetical protein
LSSYWRVANTALAIADKPAAKLSSAFQNAEKIEIADKTAENTAGQKMTRFI